MLSKPGGLDRAWIDLGLGRSGLVDLWELFMESVGGDTIRFGLKASTGPTDRLDLIDLV